jgi:uncharacterized protein YdiU (UPF0061 family)
MPGALTDLSFDNRFVRELPADPVIGQHTRQVRDAVYSRVRPTPVAAPRLLAVSREMAAQLDLDPAVDPGAFAEVFSGNRLLPGMDPYAVRYGGHQFGQWAGQLGDGRAISLGEVVNAAGERWELQLKGAGPTPYSRRADGRAVLRSSVREFVCSEAMFHLGVPTTRALCLVGTGEPVWRDMFYDGNPEQEPGAVVCRVAPSFVRFGNFEILAASGETELLGRLVDQVIDTHFPHLGPRSPDRILRWVAEVSARTARMVVHWMRVGFVHGVMNTDNMSVLGLTIDYGPYGWLEDFDPGWTPNTTDAERRRYRWGNQPQVAQWNLVRFGSALLPLVGEVGPLEDALREYSRVLAVEQPAMWWSKLGVQGGGTDDVSLVDDLLGLLTVVETDMTVFFRGLARVPHTADPRRATRAVAPGVLRSRPATIPPGRPARLAGSVPRSGGPRARRRAWTRSTPSTCSGTTSPSSRSTRWRRGIRASWTAPSTPCVARTTSSPATRIWRRSARSGRATGPGARCCRVQLLIG